MVIPTCYYESATTTTKRWRQQPQQQHHRRRRRLSWASSVAWHSKHCYTFYIFTAHKKTLTHANSLDQLLTNKQLITWNIERNKKHIFKYSFFSFLPLFRQAREVFNELDETKMVNMIKSSQIVAETTKIRVDKSNQTFNRVYKSSEKSISDYQRVI